MRRFRLDGTGRLLDLGCGTGQLALPLARHVGEAVGVDPEAEMLQEAAAQARAAGITNVTWTLDRSGDLPGNFGRFRLVTMGRSFHWMDRDQVLAALAGMVTDDGGLVIVGDSCLVQASTPWQRMVDAVQQRFLGPDHNPSHAAPTQAAEGPESVLARSAFQHVERFTYEFSRRWTIERIIGYLYSTSIPLRHLLGDQRSAFEHTLTDALQELSDADLVEAVTVGALIATRT